MFFKRTEEFFSKRVQLKRKAKENASEGAKEYENEV